MKTFHVFIRDNRNWRIIELKAAGQRQAMECVRSCYPGWDVWDVKRIPYSMTWSEMLPRVEHVEVE